MFRFARQSRPDQTAAGARPPRRRAAFTVAWAALAGTALTAAACSSAAPKAQDTSVFTITEHVSLQQVKQGVTALYQDHPGITSYAAQGVQYTTASRDKTLTECTTSGGASATQTTETAQVTACAPLIFFLYSYGKQESVRAAEQTAGLLYWYSVEHIAGPTSPQASLDEVLSSWQLPVPALTPAQRKAALTTSVITAAEDSMLGLDSVHMVITTRFSGGTSATAEQIVADVGTTTGDEDISTATATATIRLTGKEAYFTGNQGGLTSLLGLSTAAAKKTGSHWVQIKSGTSEYQDLAAENTMSSLPASILPTTSDTVQTSTGTQAGAKVYILTWKTTASDSDTTISARLTLTDASSVLPVTETLTADGETKVVTLSGWGKKFTVDPPGSAIPYSSLAG